MECLIVSCGMLVLAYFLVECQSVYKFEFVRSVNKLATSFLNVVVAILCHEFAFEVC